MATLSKNILRLARLTCAASIAGAFAIPAMAAAPATYYFGSPSFTLPPTIANLPVVATGGAKSFSDGLGGTVTAQLSISPAPRVDLTLNNTSSGTLLGGAGIEYFYTIAGPGTGPVAGTLRTSMAVTGAANADIAALLSGTDIAATFPVLNPAVCMSARCTPFGYPTSLTDDVLNINFSRSGHIDLVAAGRLVGAGAATAFVDPIITLASGYTLTLSEGVGNGSAITPPDGGGGGGGVTAPVPEPETYALMAVGLGVLALVRRRKNKL